MPPTVVPYYTTDKLVDAIQTNIMFPTSQNTLTYADIVEMINQEIHMNAVPTIKELHEEYFVYACLPVDLVENISRYPIPSRALGGALRDLNWADSNGNFYPLTRVDPKNKPFFQQNLGGSQQVSTYYIEGNDIVLSSAINAGTGASLNFFIFLRPNFLVRNDRAAVIESFKKDIVISNYALIAAGDTITITTNVQTSSPTETVFTASSGSPGTLEFQIGDTNAATATNLYNAINTAAIEDFVATNTTSGTVTTTYVDAAATFEVSGSGITIDNDYMYIKFDALEAAYTDPDTDVVDPNGLYLINSKVDFLQTNPGHRTFTYDVKIRAAPSGNIGKFLLTDLQGYLSNTNGGTLQTLPIKVGDYICLANECIIPQIPPELHVALIERASARMLKAIGDKEGYAIAKAEIQEMNQNQATMIGQRIDSAVPKIFNPNSLLRQGKRRRWRW